MNINSKLLESMMVSMALLASPYALAASSNASPEMQKAFAKADQGSDQLRWFVQRTKTVYGLDYADVLQRRAQAVVAAADGAVVVARAPMR